MNTFRSILALFGACCAVSLSAQPGLSDTVDLKISSSELHQKDTITITDTVYVTIRDTVYVNVPAQPSRRDLNRQKDFISRTPVFAALPSVLEFAQTMPIESVMLSNHLMLCLLLLLLPSVFPSIRVFSSVFTSGGQSFGASASGSVLFQ